MNLKTLRSYLFQSVLCIAGLLFVLLSLHFPAPSVTAAEGYPTPTPNCAVTPMPSSPPLVALPTCTVSPTPYQDGETLIPTNYQPPAPYTAQLGWLVFTPTPAPSASPPGIIVIHGGDWRFGNALQVSEGCQDLAEAGYYVVSVAYELARCGYIQGQNGHEHDYDGTLPDDMVTRQTNDIKAFVNALRNDPHVDHDKIGVVGGSAGATHAVWTALDTTDTGSAWPFWNAAARPQCAVMLSAAYDFSDRTGPSGLHGADPEFILATENYVNTADLPTLKARSPISMMTAPTQQVPFVPLFMINSWFDSPTSYHQIVDMICKLNSVGVSASAYQTLTVPDSSAHAFGLWNHCDGISTPCKST